jgi:hypothetical protein
MGVDLRMEPYATMFEKERPKSRIIDELCFPDIDKLLEYLGRKWDEYSVDAVSGRLPHDAALRLLTTVETHQIPAQKLLTLLHYYRDWYENPDRVAMQMQGISKARAPRLELTIFPTSAPGWCWRREET